METQGFYKHDGYQLFYAPNFVEMPDTILIASEKDTYEYPVNGWIWADSEEEAVAQLGGVKDFPSPPYAIEPEGYSLKTSKYDENEFSKLITLTQLALNANQVSLEDEIVIFDTNSIPHSITIERFLQIMLGYGMFCYQNRN